MEPFKQPDNFRADVAHIGKSVIVKGELSGSEDLFLDGEVEGNIDLQDHNLTIGPHGRVHAVDREKRSVVAGRPSPGRLHQAGSARPHGAEFLGIQPGLCQR